MTPLQVSAIKKIQGAKFCCTTWAWKLDFGISPRTLASLLKRGLVSGFCCSTDPSNPPTYFIGSASAVEAAAIQYRDEGISVVLYGTPEANLLRDRLNGVLQ